MLSCSLTLSHREFTDIDHIERNNVDPSKLNYSYVTSSNVSDCVGVRLEHEKFLEDHRRRLEKLEQSFDATSPHFEFQKAELLRTNSVVRE